MPKSHIFSAATVTGVCDWLIQEGLLDLSRLGQHRGHPERRVVRTCLDSWNRAVARGYRLVLEEVGSRVGGQQALPHFKIDSAAVDRLHDSEHFRQSMETGVVMQAVLGYSGGAMAEAFEIAHWYVEGHRLAEAADIYLWLIYLNPFVGWFWQGLGDCWHQAEQCDEAFYAYCVAINCDLYEPRLYRSACQCCMDRGNYGKARELLARGIELMEHAPKSRENRDKRRTLQYALAYVNDCERDGRIKNAV